MKKILSLLLLLPLLGIAQTSDLQKENASLKARIDSLEKRLDDKYYTRVPNKDFDKQLGDMVDRQVGDYFSGKLAIISSVVFFISFLIGYLFKFYTSESTRKQIKDSVEGATKQMKDDNEEAQKNLNLQFDTQKSFVSDNNKLYNERLGDISTRIDNLRNGLNLQIQNFSATTEKRIGDFESNIKTQLTQLTDQYSVNINDIKTRVEKFENSQQEFIRNSTQELDNKIAETLGFLWADVIGSMIDRAAERNYNGEDLVKSFEKLLRTNISLAEESRIKVIDTLMRCYYSTANLDKKYDKMVKLVQEYENKYELFPETYVNAAIALTNNYQSYGTDDLRENAIVNCDKSIRADRGYGIPYAIKLEIFLIDLVKARDAGDRQRFTKEVDDLIYLVNSINSPLLKGEFLQRLQQDKKVAALTKYIEYLYDHFPVELSPLREKVVAELTKNFDHTNEQEKVLFTELLQEGLITNPDIDGKWKATEYLSSGSPAEIKQTVYLNLKEKDYSFLLDDKIAETGIVFYYPLVMPNVMVLICTSEGANKNTITRGIYKLREDKSLQICLAKPETPVPTEFASDNTNGYSLISFDKV